MREYILGRNSTNVWNVGKPTVTDQTFVDTKKFTIKKDSINGRNMGHLFSIAPLLLSIRDFIEEISPMKFNSSQIVQDSSLENN